MKFAERRPFSASDDAENGSKIANRNSLWEIRVTKTEDLKLDYYYRRTSYLFQIKTQNCRLDYWIKYIVKS